MKYFTVSILIYKDISGLERLLKSLVQQKEFIKVLIISNDSPNEIDIEYIKNISFEILDPSGIETHYCQNSQNIGVIKHFAKLVEKVKTDFCFFTGCDDNIKPGFFKNAFDEFQVEDVNIVTPNQIRLDENFQVIGKSNWDNNNLGELPDIIRSENFGVPSAGSCFRTSIFERLKYQKNMINEDDQVMLLGLLQGRRIISKKYLFEYRIVSSSLSSWLRQPFISENKLRDTLKREFDNRISQNHGWIRSIEIYTSSLPQKKYLIKICLTNIALYEQRKAKLDGLLSAYWFTLSFRRKLLRNLVALRLKTIICNTRILIQGK